MKLSRLQKTILLLALEKANRRRKGLIPPLPPMWSYITDKINKTDVTPVDVKVAYYGFPLRPKGRKIFFSKADMGSKRYNTASVDINRAFEHLARKGLAERIYGYGIGLTEKGREVAKQIRKS